MPLKIEIFRKFVQNTSETNILICVDDSFAIVPLSSVDPQTYSHSPTPSPPAKGHHTFFSNHNST